MASFANHQDIWHHIFEHCHPLVLGQLQLVNKQLHRGVSQYYTHVYKSRLSKYVDDVNSFLYVLAATKSAISGSWVLKTLFRQHVPKVSNDHLDFWEDPIPQDWDSNDLDIYMKRSDPGADLFRRFLTSQGYIETPIATDPLSRWRKSFGNRPPPEDDEELLDELRYVDPSPELQAKSKIHLVTQYIKGDKQIDIIESKTQDGVEPIFAFHSTAVMNYAFFDSLTCMFPRTTFKGENIHNADCIDVPRRSSHALHKYRRRGFKIRSCCLRVVNTMVIYYTGELAWRIQLLPDMHAILTSPMAQSVKHIKTVSYSPSRYRKFDLGNDEKVLRRPSIVGLWAEQCEHASWLLHGNDRKLAAATPFHKNLFVVNETDTATVVEID